MKASEVEKRQVSSGTNWEDSVGYSQAVRIGDVVEVAGTTVVDNDVVIGIDDMYEQTRFSIRKTEKALQQVGTQLTDTIRTRVYVTDITRWEEVGRAHGEFFSTTKPASTRLAVKELIAPRLLVEIELTAIVRT